MQSPFTSYNNSKTDVETFRMRSVFKNLQNAFDKVMKTPRNPRRCCGGSSCSDPRYIKSARAELESNDNDKIANLQLQPQKAGKTQPETKFSSIPACRPSQSGCSFGVSRGLSTQKNRASFWRIRKTGKPKDSCRLFLVGLGLAPPGRGLGTPGFV